MNQVILKRIWKYTNPWRGKLATASSFSLANKFFDIFPEILIGVAIDVVVEQDQSVMASLGFKSPESQLGALGFLTFVIWALESVTEYVALVRWRHLAQEVQHSLRMDGVQHCQRLDLKWYEDTNSGQLLSILGEDVNQIERFFNEGIHEILQLIISSLLVSAVFFYISPIIASFALIPIPVILIGGIKFRSRLEGRYKAVRHSAGKLSEALSGLITGVMTIRAATAEKHLSKYVEGLSQDYNRANQEAIRLSTAFVPLIRIAVLTGFLITLVLGGLKTFEGTISPASYTVLVFLTQRLLWPFTDFGEILDLFERSMASASRVLNLLETPIQIQNDPNPITFSRDFDLISFKDVCFSYQQDKPILKDFNLDIPAGSFVALVGSTGSGKSTVTKLLMRFYEVNSGEIKINGTAIDRYSLKSLRESIGYVSQDVFLLDRTIKENISLQQPGASLKVIEEAAKIAEADTFINQIAGTYEAKVGERGQKLSGGQRQRLSIARSLVGSPPILILDEATSAVDNETEAAIQRSIEAFKENSVPGSPRTIIVIAHRLSTIRNADYIYVMDQGKVIEKGKHEELIQGKGFYEQLWNIQTGETK